MAEDPQDNELVEVDDEEEEDPTRNFVMRQLELQARQRALAEEGEGGDDGEEYEPEPEVDDDRLARFLNSALSSCKTMNKATLKAQTQTAVLQQTRAGGAPSAAAGAGTGGGGTGGAVQEEERWVQLTLLSRLKQVRGRQATQPCSRSSNAVPGPASADGRSFL